VSEPKVSEFAGAQVNEPRVTAWLRYCHNTGHLFV